MGLKRALAVLGVIVALSAIHLGISTKNIDLKYEVEDLKRNLSALQAETRGLRSITASKSTLRRIEKIAVGKLGMIRPDEMHYVETTSKESGD